MDPTTIDIERIVTLHFENGKVFGNVFCIICEAENRKKQTPKRVNYKSGRNGCWILSNLVKHLENVHHLIAQMKKPEESMVAQNTKNVDLIELIDSIDENDNSCMILEDNL